MTHWDVITVFTDGVLVVVESETSPNLKWMSFKLEMEQFRNSDRHIWEFIIDEWDPVGERQRQAL